MTVSRYVLLADVTVPAGTPAAPVAGEPGTGGAAGHGSTATASGPLFPAVYPRNTVIVLDPAGALYAAIGAGNLRAYADGDAVGRPGISN